MTKNNTGKKLVIGTALAAAAGYVAGILTAPKSGKDTRKDLANKAGDFKELALEQLSKAKEELEALLEQAKTKSIALGAKAREEFNEAVVKAKDARNKVVVVMKAVKAGESDQPELDKALKQAKLANKNLSKFLKS